ncbi:MAG: hypothetical protein PHR35_18165, partial [Kiritimatiellae bacterium]|nr:hypothetical protein [Kiritimatiellia bacterium]
TPISGSYLYTYDPDRRLVQTDFPSGRRVQNVFANGRLDHIVTTNPPEDTVSFGYYGDGRLKSVSKGTEAATYGYDGDLLTSDTRSGTLNQTIGYTYNNDFQVESVTYAQGEATFEYDNDGLVKKASGFTIGRDTATGLPTQIGDSRFVLTPAFNAYGEVDGETITVATQSVAAWNVTSRDPAGRIIEKTETVGANTSHYVYGYDTLGHLASVAKDGATVEQYTYGDNGERLTETNSLRGITDRRYTYDTEDHLVTAGDATYLYDVDGFLLSKTEGTAITNYTYSSRGELLRVALPDGRVVTYAYDALGQRVSKAINGTPVEKYLWASMTDLLAVYDEAGVLKYRFEGARGVTGSGDVYYMITDQVGTVRALVDSNGNVARIIEYDSFGNVLNPGGRPSALDDFPLAFAGGLYDAETGLVHFGFRDYDPDAGRWTAKDPIVFAGGSSDLYGYCLCDPVALADPAGLTWSESIALFRDFMNGTGAKIRIYGPGSNQVNDMMNAPGVNQARDYFYHKNRYTNSPMAVTDYAARFGLSGALMAGVNSTRQFVGSYDVNIYPINNGREIRFILYNNTSLKSLAAGLLGSYERVDEFGLCGNMREYFTWTEPVNWPDTHLQTS